MGPKGDDYSAASIRADAFSRRAITSGSLCILNRISSLRNFYAAFLEDAVFRPFLCDQMAVWRGSRQMTTKALLKPFRVGSARLDNFNDPLPNFSLCRSPSNGR